MTPEQLLGLRRYSRAKTSTKDLAPEIEIIAVPEMIAVGTQKSQPIRLAPADDVAMITARPPVEPPAPWVTRPLPPIEAPPYVVPALPPATSAAAEPTELVTIGDRPGPFGAVVGFALVALAFVIGAYLVL